MDYEIAKAAKYKTRTIKSYLAAHVTQQQDGRFRCVHSGNNKNHIICQNCADALLERAARQGHEQYQEMKHQMA